MPLCSKPKPIYVILYDSININTISPNAFIHKILAYQTFKYLIRMCIYKYTLIYIRTYVYFSK